MWTGGRMVRAVMSKEKAKTLFDHVNHVMVGKDPNYFSSLTEDDRKSWSNWMINKVLSMTPEYCEYINEIQRIQFLAPEIYYKILCEIIPKRRVYSKYVKKTSKSKLESEDVELISNYFAMSKREVVENEWAFSDEFIKKLRKEYGKQKQI
jgi:hypothetical protein